jgi:hypothetical protein
MPGGDTRGGTPGATPESAAGGMPGRGDARGGGMPPGGMRGGSSDVTATFKNVALKGDMVSSMTGQSDVIIKFENATITGAITTATATPVGEPSYEKFYLIGEVTHTYCATNDKYGIKASFDGKSKWIVDKTSYLTDLTVAEGTGIVAPEGFVVTMTVNGAPKPIKPGNYKGKIVLKVAKS